MAKDPRHMSAVMMPLLRVDWRSALCLFLRRWARDTDADADADAEEDVPGRLVLVLVPASPGAALDAPLVRDRNMPARTSPSIGC